MILSKLSVIILLNLSNILGVSEVPPISSDWNTNNVWYYNDNIYSFKAISSKIVEQCNQNKEAFVYFPPVIHGAHEIYLDTVLIAAHGDKNFKSTSTFYGSPIVSCYQISPGSELTWVAYSSTKYFARFTFYPHVLSKYPVSNFIREGFNLIAAGSLILLCIFTGIIFRKKINNKIIVALSISALGFSIYFCMTVPGIVGLKISMLSAHRYADIGVWIGAFAMFCALFYEDLIKKWMLITSGFIILVAICIIASAPNGDQIQFGTSLPFLPTLLLFGYALYGTIEKYYNLKVHKKWTLFHIAALLSFFISGLFEMLSVLGVVSTPPFLPIGVVGAILFFSLSVNEQIMSVYSERDYLALNLEQEVERKTNELKLAQAELIQTAKLASLGTLSAGLAHEINNSVNYVNGALLPLEKLISKNVTSKDESEKINRLFAVMKDGLRLTVDIIKSLRNYSGINQAQFNDVKIIDVVNSVLTILKNKLRDKVTVNIHIDNSLTVYGAVVGLNQIFMNLISNSIDAMPADGQLTISARQIGDYANIEIADTGYGIPKDIEARIFDPFFTTKGVGKGTGLGLYIVKKEVERHGGTISVASTKNSGTTFTLLLPIKSIEVVKGVA